MKPITLLIEQLLVCSIIMAFLSGFIFFQPVGEPIVSNPVPLKGGIPKIFLMVVDGLRQDHVLTLHSDIDDGGSASIRFFGDDTWSAMFPGHFVFADPVSSFFVSDYTEVDRNVSRHLRSLFNGSEELASWDVAILHYLGLDHIGHSHGSKHRLIDDKLTQMSNVVRAANLRLEASGCNYLILVCGDHGMLDEGGHGGSSYEELHTAAVFMGPRVESRKSREQLMIRQVDLSSTLAVLSGVSVPASSVGVPLLSLLSPLVDAYDLLQLYKSEAKRLLHILEAASLPAGQILVLWGETYFHFP
ncbi:hypothetical protein HAZT_HAZT010370 [Hyalella azteca]|uniref:GPI ethanolamine phosphate transferase 2 n=1 Tax=Hyalella azteca TaxID=294128 RepID=A0A6A0H4S4_HYAAZ|nr:hypothetical protein HAZT_HAZT010370 [Hyalella azteca]